MITLDVDQGISQRFSLAEDSRVTRKGGGSPLKIDSWIELASPAVTCLTDQLIGKDHELSAFWAAEKGRYVYHYVSLACSFGPAEGKAFTKAWVECELAGADGSEPPIAWSMAPFEVIDASEVSQTDKLGGDFKLLQGNLNLSVSDEVVVKHPAKEWFLRTNRLRSSRPYWEFRSTVQTPIAGSWKLAMVTRSPAGSVASGRISVRAVVEKRTFLMFRTDEPFSEPSSLTFALGTAT